MAQLPTLYVEDPSHEMPKIYLEDAEYSRGLTAFVTVCIDIIAINSVRKTVYVAERKIESMKGWWDFGGRLRPREKELDCVRRLMKRETGLELDDSRYRFIGMKRYWCSKRLQSPVTAGGDYLVYIFAVELDEAEVAQASASLDLQEYNSRELKECTREELVALGVRPPLIEIYDAIFS